MKKYILSLALVLVALISYGQTNGDFRSRQTGNWNDSNTWEEYQSGWSNTANTPSSTDGAITVLNGHTVTVIANVIVDEVTVDVGGTVLVDLFTTLTITDGTGDDFNVNGSLTLIDDAFFDGSILTVEGQLVNTGTVTSDPTLSFINFNANSTYVHNQSGGFVPVATWNSTSTISIDIGASTSAPSNLNQIFGNFTWNSATQSGTTDMGLSGNTTTIAGDLTVSATNNRVLLLSTSTGVSVQVSGNVAISGTSRLAQTSEGNVIMSVAGNYTLTSSSTSYLGTTGTGILNIDGNFEVSSGTLQGTATSDVNFSGSSVQNFTSGGTFTNINFDVNSGAIVNAGTSVFSGIGTFTQNANSTLQVGSTDASGALQTGTIAGNIRVSGARTYTAGSTIVYNGAATQQLGNDFPTDVNLTIENNSGVTLSGAATISSVRTLTLTNGNLSIGANTLTLDGTVSGTGGITGGATSSLSIGGTGAFGTLIFAGSNVLNNFTVNRTSSGSVTLGGDLSIIGTFTQTAGDVDINGNTFTLSGAFARTGGSILSNNASSLIIDGTGALPASVAFSGGLALNTLTINRNLSTLTSTASLAITNLNLYDGTFSNGGTITMATGGVITRNEGGSITNIPSTSSSYDVIYDIATGISSGNELPSSSTALNNLTKLGSAQLTLASDITINGDFTLTNGPFDASTNSIDFKGNFISNATSSLTSSALTFSGTTVISGSQTPTFNDITVTGVLTPPSNLNINGNLVNSGTLNAGSGTVTFGGTTAISGSSTSSFNNVVVSSSNALTAPSGTMNVAGNFTNNGTFTHNSGTVNFNGTTTLAGTLPSFSSISIAGSSSLTAPASDLNIAGDFTNSGTFSTTGTLVFNGTATQTIAGTSALAIGDLTINSSNATVLNNNTGGINLTGTLTVGSTSTLDADGSGSGVFTLVSNASGTASVADLSGGGSITGSVIYQRYFDGGGDVWRNFGVAVNGATVSNITGSGFTINGNDLAEYDETETTLGTVNDGWVLQSTFGANISNSQGYSMWTRAAQMTNTIDFTGTLNAGNQSMTVTYTSTGSSTDDGWNLVNNPFASTVGWDTFTKAGLDGTVYVWNTSSSTYDIWNGSTGGLTDGLISSGQSFWVHATSAPSLTIKESDKSTTSSSFLRTGALTDHLVVSLSQGDKIDKTYIHFREDATDALEGGFDGLKLSNGIFNLSSLATSGESLAINSVSKTGCKTIKLNITNISTGGYNLLFEDINTFAVLGATLIDNFTNTSVSLTEGYVYNFDVTADIASYGDTRFELQFAATTLNTNLTMSSLTTCDTDLASIYLDNSQIGVEYSLVNANGTLQTLVGDGFQLEFSIAKSILVEGLNDFDIYMNNNGNCGDATVSSAISIEHSGVSEISSAQGGNSCGKNSITLSAVGAPTNGSYNWYETIDAISPIVGENADAFTTPLISTTATYYVTVVNALGCESLTRVPVVAEIFEVPEIPTITVDGAALLSSALSGNQWYKDGTAIDGATNTTYEVTETGNYSVEVNNGNCSTTSVETPMEITGLNDDNINRNIIIYPNPVGNEDLTINFVQYGKEIQRIVLVDNSGRELKVLKIKKGASDVKLDFSSYNNGIYYVNVISNQGSFVYKVLKRK